MKADIKIVIANDHPLFRRGLRQMIETDLRLKIVGEADDGEIALQRIQETEAEIAILDVAMPNKDGFEVVQALREQKVPVEVIFLTMHKDERFLNAALDLGVKGYVLKDSALLEIADAIRAVSAGHNYISPALSTYLVKRSSSNPFAESSPQQSKFDLLTSTERHVLKLIAAYKTSKEIAAELFISTRTVEHHRANISQKLELRGSHALLQFAVKHQAQL
ncbi:MAG: response regulator transcription factor [Pyrinomonadaceae bacterium]|nr:response regulator transcription factor [Pyrinomonadaceae bacterium]